MSDDGRREFLRVVQENASEPGGALTEAEFFASLGKVFEGTGSRHVMISPRALEAGRAAGERGRMEAQVAYMEHRRLPRWRWLRRLRLAEQFMAARVISDSFEATFGRRG